MKLFRRQGLVVVAAVTALTVCSPLLAAARTVRGSGHAASATRAVAAGVARVAVDGDFEVEIRQGAQPGVTLEGDDNLLPLVETRIDGPSSTATLHIAPARGIDLEPTQRIRVRIVLAALAGIEVSGSGHVSSDGLHADRLAVAIGGSGRVELARLDATRLAVSIGGSGAVRADGRSRELAVHIGGSGRCDAGRLSVDDATISIGGSGRADVDAGRRLDVSIAGSGRVTQRGAAVPTARIAGSGRIDRG